MIFQIFILPVSSGLLYWLSSQAFSFPLLVWICLVPFGLSLYRSTPRKGLASGFVCGFVFWFLGVWWLKINLINLVGLPPWQAWGWTVVFCAYHAVPYAIFGCLAARFHWLERPLGPLLAAALLVVMRIWYPAVFPGNEAHNLSELPLLIQVLDLGGVPLLLFIVYLVNFLIMRALLCWREKTSPVPALVAVAIIFTLLISYGGYRLHDLHQKMQQAPDRQQISIISVQPNAPVNQAIPDVPPEDIKNNMTTALALCRTASLWHPEAELIVLPEQPAGYLCSDVVARDLPHLIKDTGMAVMTPCAGTVDDTNRFYYNSVAYLDKNGVIAEEYRKNILVPFGEYIPLEARFPFLRRLFPGVMPFKPGEKTLLYDLGKGRQGIPALCYEAVFTGHVRRFVEHGGTVLLNMVDDAWFGKTKASKIHLSLAMYRAVEYRIPLVRVTNSGVGVFVQATGEIVPGSKTPLFQKSITSARLFIPEKRSPYSHWGDLFLYGLTVLSVVSVGWEFYVYYKRKELPCKT